MSTQVIDLTVEDMAYVLGVTRATIYNRQKAGEIPEGKGIDVVQVAIREEERRIERMRERLREVVARRLLEGF